MKMFLECLKAEDGVTAIEYGLIVALVAIAAVVVLKAVGVSLNATFQKVNANMQ